MTTDLAATARPGELAGRTALVTGAGNGLGRAIALALAGAGARVILAGRTAAHAARDGGDRGRARAATRIGARRDLRRLRRPSRSTRCATRSPGEDIDLLVNNAGIGGPVKAITDIEPAEWDEVFGANVRSVYLMCRAFLPAMYRARQRRRDQHRLGHRQAPADPAHSVRGVEDGGARPDPHPRLRGRARSASGSTRCRPGRAAASGCQRNFTAEAAATGTSYAAAEEAFVSRAALRRLVEEDEVALAVLAMLRMPGLCGADIDLSAGMIAPA